MKLGSKQLELLNVLWDLGRANARQVTDALNDRGLDVAHSTVQTQLRLLMKKGAVGFEKDDRTFVFFPLIDREEAASDGVTDILDRVFGGSASALVSHLLSGREVDPEELDEIRRMLDKHSSNTQQIGKDARASRKRR